MKSARGMEGLLLAIAAYTTWGLAPIYWRALRPLPALPLVAHRVLWTLPLVATLVAARGRLPALLAALRLPAARRAMAASTLLISVNWLLFVWAVTSGRVLAASLGYYMNPLVNVLLGRMFLGERLRPVQLGAVALAALGVLALAIHEGGLPWISLALAITFGLYGLVRKTAPVESLEGLTLECLLMAPVALLCLPLSDMPFVSLPLRTFGLVALSGVVTGVPLLCFAAAARRLRYSTLGIVQYLAPTLQFVLAVKVFGEPFDGAQLFTFACIWAAVALYAADALRATAPLPVEAPEP